MCLNDWTAVTRHLWFLMDKSNTAISWGMLHINISYTHWSALCARQGSHAGVLVSDAVVTWVKLSDKTRKYPPLILKIFLVYLVPGISISLFICINIKLAGKSTKRAQRVDVYYTKLIKLVAFKLYKLVQKNARVCSLCRLHNRTQLVLLFSTNLMKTYL